MSTSLSTSTICQRTRARPSKPTRTGSESFLRSEWKSRAIVLQSSKLFASCDEIEDSPRRRGGLRERDFKIKNRERDFKIKNLCELCVLCGESPFSDSVAAVPRYDERGAAEYDLALGAKRAQATKDYLVTLGIAADRISTVSYGEKIPVCKEHNETCWQKNRRDRFVVLAPKPGV
ncbi:MAG: OmpA family protein [Deltaproteobacteria bacterium]|nr:OmpA family protein [Deltaproteobacteria bacterium]